VKEERTSFLKKRSKKLLSVSGSTEPAHAGASPGAMSKSFLLLFFKKEALLPQRHATSAVHPV
jgi:hypothetical protein